MEDGLIVKKTLQSLTVDQQPPNQGNAKSNQDNTIDAIDDMNVMGRKTVADFSSQHYFGYIKCQYKGQAGSKNDDALMYRMSDERSGRSDPNQDAGGIECIHEKSRGKDLCVIPLSEFKYDLFAFHVHRDLLEENKEYAHGDKENTTNNAYFRAVSV